MLRWFNEIFTAAKIQAGNGKIDYFNSYQFNIWKFSRLAEIQGFWHFWKKFGPIIVTKLRRVE